MRAVLSYSYRTPSGISVGNFGSALERMERHLEMEEGVVVGVWTGYMGNTLSQGT
jgi:hypothetical protein